MQHLFKQHYASIKHPLIILIPLAAPHPPWFPGPHVATTRRNVETSALGLPDRIDGDLHREAKGAHGQLEESQAKRSWMIPRVSGERSPHGIVISLSRLIIQPLCRVNYG